MGRTSSLNDFRRLGKVVLEAYSARKKGESQWVGQKLELYINTTLSAKKKELHHLIRR